MTEFTPIASSIGGLLIGLSAALMLVLKGRICGISGIIGGMPSAARADRPRTCLLPPIQPPI